jgi:cellobiose-specific phosphotransferase system component IIC
MHSFEFMIPITLFVCITYAIKAVVDARVRKQLVSSNVSQELIQSIVEADELRRRHATLRWGAILIALSFGFGLMEAFGLRDVTPGVFAILLGATGVGNLVAYYLSRKMPA